MFAAIVASIAALEDLQNAARLVAQTLLWFAITALIAVLIGIALGILLEPGLRTGVDAAAAAAPATTGSWFDFLKSLVPGNFLGLSASTKIAEGAPATSLSFNVLQIIVLAIAIGAAAVRAGPAGEGFLAFNASLLAIFKRLLLWVIRLTPIGTAALIGDAIARYGWEALGSLGQFAIAIYAGLLLVVALVYPVLLRLNGVSPLRFFGAAWPAIELGFVSRSSIGTLPVTQEVVERRLGVPPAYAAFAVPLGATTKMDGCAAIYPAIAAIFVAQFYGIHLGIDDYLLIVLVSVLGSAATAGLHGRDRHADADALDDRAPARRRRAAAGDRSDPRHGADRGQCGGAGAGSDDRRQARGTSVGARARRWGARFCLRSRRWRPPVLCGSLVPVSSTSLPVIDIEPLLRMTDAAAVADAVRRIGAAAGEFGFFYAAGHGIGAGVLSDLLDASRTFFALPEDEKARISMDKGGIAWRGWFPVAGELTSGIPDLKEGLYLGEELGPDDPRVKGLPAAPRRQSLARCRARLAPCRRGLGMSRARRVRAKR